MQPDVSGIGAGVLYGTVWNGYNGDWFDREQETEPDAYDFICSYRKKFIYLFFRFIIIISFWYVIIITSI